VQSIEEHSRREPVAGIDQAEIFELTFDDGSHLYVAVDRSAARYIQSLRGDGDRLRRKEEEQ
jgi:hypothetical protein